MMDAYSVPRYVFAASKAVYTGAYDKNRRHGDGVMKYARFARARIRIQPRIVIHSMPAPMFSCCRLSRVCLSYADKSSYEGQYVGGVRHGQGTFKFANGDWCVSSLWCACVGVM